MRIIVLHCYPGTKEWIACQGPYVEALARYWNRSWMAKTEDEVLKDFTDAGVEALLVALDLETTIKTPPLTNEYVHAMWKRHPKRREGSGAAPLSRWREPATTWRSTTAAATPRRKGSPKRSRRSAWARCCASATSPTTPACARC